MLDPISCPLRIFLTHSGGVYPPTDFTVFGDMLFLAKQCPRTCHPHGFRGNLKHQLSSVQWCANFQGLLSSYPFLWIGTKPLHMYPLSQAVTSGGEGWIKQSKVRILTLTLIPSLLTGGKSYHLSKPLCSDL